jgi:hypothetical protein
MSKYLHAIYLAIILALLVGGAFLFHTWLEAHDDQLRLHSTLETQKQIVDAADARERDRDASLKATLAQIAALKRATQTPEQVLRDLPNYLPLPQPITLSPASSAGVQERSAGHQGIGTSSRQGSGTSQNSTPAAASGNPQTSSSPPSPLQELPSAPVAQIPGADLKPLYDYAQDCRACQARLASAKQDATDNAAKLAALTRERDAAIRAAKGGGFWLRLRHNALWFVVGASAGAAALCASGHCRP